MDTLRKFWPWSFKMEKGNVKKLVWTVVIYALISMGLGILSVPFALIPVFRVLWSVFTFVAGLYLTAGAVFCFLNYFEVGPFKN